MKTLPTTVAPYRRTPEFSSQTVPAALLRRHNTKAGVWGQIIVLQGTLIYRILEPELAEHRLDASQPGIVEPGIHHEVAPGPDCRFYVQFYR